MVRAIALTDDTSELASAPHRNTFSQYDDDEQLVTRLTGHKSNGKFQNGGEYMQQRRIGVRRRR
jgi:hypothetical protein